MEVNIKKKATSSKKELLQNKKLKVQVENENKILILAADDDFLLIGFRYKLF